MFGGPNDFYDLGLQGTRNAFEYPSYINTIDSNVAFDSADDDNDDIEFPRLQSTAFNMVKQEGPIMDPSYQKLSNLKFDDFEDSEYSSSSDNFDVDTEQSNNQNGAIGTLQLLQQNIPSHLLLVSLLEHICFLYDSNQSRSKELFKVLCQQLTATKLLPKFAIIEEFQPIRERYRSTLTELMEFAVHTVKQQEGMRKLSFGKSLNWRPSKVTNQSYVNANIKSPLIQTPSRYLEEFEEIDTLGKGGFGSVYHVRNKLDGKRYAVKKIDLAFVKPDDCFKVLREVKVLANLDHPNIVRYYSAWLEYAFTDKHHQKKFPARYQEQRSLSRLQRQFSSTTDDSAHFQHDDSSSSSDVIFFKTGSDTDLKEAGLTDSSISNKLSCNKDDHLPTCKQCLQIQGHRSMIRGRFGDWPIPSRANALFGNPQNNKMVFRRSLSSGNVDILNDDVRTTKPLMNKLLVNNPGQFDFKTLQLTMHIQMGLCSSTLKHWLSDRNNSIATHGDVIDWNINMKVFKQLLDGVHYIHCFGLMHRDLKPRNIFINRNCDSEDINVKIGDFGLARSDVISSVERSNCKTTNFSFANRDMSDEHATKGIGTVTYAAPEQLEKHSYTAKADIYSLGIILFELFAPFTTEMERLLLIRNLRQGKLPAYVKEKWPEESTFIIQMTEFQPDLRPDAAIILKAQFFEDKDKIIVKLRADLLERTKQMNELKELLSKKEIEIKHLQQNAEKS